jgi:hypothetical protein
MATLLFRISSIHSKTDETVLEDLQSQTKALEQHLAPYLAISERYSMKFFCELEETDLLDGGAELVNAI